jgi:DNA transformation protein
MSVGAAFLQYVLEQLERTGRVTSRRMFGGVGLYCADIFFGLIDDDTLYFRVDEQTRPEYQARGGKPFRPFRDRPEVSMTYYTVPADVLDDAEELVIWARRAVAIGAAAPKKARPRKVTSVAPKKRVRASGQEKKR